VPVWLIDLLNHSTQLAVIGFGMFAILKIGKWLGKKADEWGGKYTDGMTILAENSVKQTEQSSKQTDLESRLVAMAHANDIRGIHTTNTLDRFGRQLDSHGGLLRDLHQRFIPGSTAGIEPQLQQSFPSPSHTEFGLAVTKSVDPAGNLHTETTAVVVEHQQEVLPPIDSTKPQVNIVQRGNQP
jgi:hypothetical protein